MSATVVSICNRALQILGEESILNLTEDNNKARALNITYEPVRDAELHRRRWRFSIARASLAADSSPPASDYARRFLLPNDYLRLVPGGALLSMSDLSDYRGRSSALWSVEGRYILTDLPAPLQIRYIYRVTDAGLFNPSFAEALAARIAAECCYRITGSDTKEQLCWGKYKAAIKEATIANALEGAPESRADDTWVTARLQ